MRIVQVCKLGSPLRTPPQNLTSPKILSLPLSHPIPHQLTLLFPLTPLSSSPPHHPTSFTYPLNLLSTLLTNLKSARIQVLKHPTRIILPTYLHQLLEALALSIQTQRLLPSAGVVEENEWIVQVLLLRGGFNRAVDAVEGVGDVGIVGGEDVVAGEEEGWGVWLADVAKPGEQSTEGVLC